MHRLLLIAAAFAIATKNTAANGMQKCHAGLSQQCSVDIDQLDYVFHNPGKCQTQECIYTPRKGYTEDPNTKYQVYFQPEKFTKKILFSFKKFEATLCAFRNQMCHCDSKETCKCNMKGGSVCKQQYITEKAYFLVFDDVPKSSVPSMPAPPQRPYKPTHSYPPPPPKYYHFSPPQAVPPPPPTPLPTQSTDDSHGMYELPGSSHQAGSHSGGNIYQIPTPKKRSLMLNYLMGNGGGDNMMMPSAGLFGGLFGKDGDDKKDNFLQYILMSKMMNQNQYYPQHHHPHGTPQRPQGGQEPPSHPKPEAKQEIPEVGSYFDPKILMYMLSKNSGSSIGKDFYQLLPYLTGNYRSKYKLKLESLYVKIPSGCSCRKNEQKEIDPLLKYFFLMQRFPYGKSPFSNFPNSPPAPVPAPEFPPGNQFWY